MSYGCQIPTVRMRHRLVTRFGNVRVGNGPDETQFIPAEDVPPIRNDGLCNGWMFMTYTNDRPMSLDRKTSSNYHEYGRSQALSRIVEKSAPVACPGWTQPARFCLCGSGVAPSNTGESGKSCRSVRDGGCVSRSLYRLQASSVPSITQELRWRGAM